MKDKQFDVIVIGAGHNGLTAANYLAMGGLRVCVLERRPVVGGAAVTEEFHPGYRNSVASYVVSLLRPEVVRELALERYGYEPIPLSSSFYVDSRGDYLLLTGDDEHDRAEFAKYSLKDYDAYRAFEHAVEAVSDVLAKRWLKAPPRLAGGGVSDLASAALLGLDVARLDDDTRWRFMQFLLGPPDTIIERWFESDKVKAMIAAHTLPANYASLQHPGCALALLHHAVGEVNGRKGAWGVVRGGMGAITRAMAEAARERNVTIRTGVAVERILVDEGRVSGVQIDGGNTLLAPVVAANTDPKRTFLQLLGEKHLPESFARDIKVIRQESASLRMNLALSGLPQFACLPGGEIGLHHRGSITFIESKDHVEQAYRSARAGVPADPPIIEAIIPSTIDTELTDKPGTHVMSLLCKYIPYDLADGKNWDDEKAAVTARILDHVGRFIPNLKDIIVGVQCLTPLDIERTFGMTRGDICHGRLEPDQMFSMRPHPAAAQYATPVTGLYLCGSGTHPGGGVTGAPGRNAARRMLQDHGKRWSSVLRRGAASRKRSSARV